jgi:hypothetical protein
MCSVPVIPASVCKEERVYGPEKLSAGMFCAGLLQVSSITTLIKK